MYWSDHWEQLQLGSVSCQRTLPHVDRRSFNFTREILVFQGVSRTLHSHYVNCLCAQIKGILWRYSSLSGKGIHQPNQYELINEKSENTGKIEVNF